MKSGDRLSHYRLIERIGSGGMGIVWKAYDTVLERPVAVKILPDEVARDPGRLARFEREARTLAALNHPGIVTIHSVETDGAVPFLTLEWIAGRTLDELVVPGGMEPARFFPIALAVVDAVGAAEAEGILHRDLKPANVIVTNDGRVKVLDFGLARAAAEAPLVSTGADTRSLSGERIPAGTLHYLSPEALRGEAVDHRSDIFALGVIFYELITGRRPFSGHTAYEVTASILRDAPEPPLAATPGWPREAGEIVMRCLDKDPARRYATTFELKRSLEALASRLAGLDPGKRSIAVLPFADMSREQDQGYFCDGVAEEITNALSRIAGLYVASRTSAFRFRGSGEDPAAIGRRLGVETLLSGSVRKSGDRIRVTTELTSASDGYRLWSEQFDRDARDIFAIQDEIARSVVESLRVSLSPHERRVLRNTATADTVAYEYFLRGRPLLHRHNRKGIESARRMFQHAIGVDPRYALAHAGIADCCSFFYLYVDANPEHRDRALAASRRALELDPALAQVQVSHGMALSLFGRTDEAVSAYERAIELEPRCYDAHFFYAREMIMSGDFPRAAQLLERACEIRPEDVQATGILGQVYENLKRHREAAVMRRRCVRNADEQLDGTGDDVRALYLSANALVALGETDAGVERAMRAVSLDPDDSMLLYNVACILAIVGRTDEALTFLERSVETGNIQVRYYERDTNLDVLRDSPRFAALMSILRARSSESPGTATVSADPDDLPALP